MIYSYLVPVNDKFFHCGFYGKIKEQSLCQFISGINKYFFLFSVLYKGQVYHKKRNIEKGLVDGKKMRGKYRNRLFYLGI